MSAQNHGIPYTKTQCKATSGDYVHAGHGRLVWGLINTPLGFKAGIEVYRVLIKLEGIVSG